MLLNFRDEYILYSGCFSGKSSIFGLFPIVLPSFSLFLLLVVFFLILCYLDVTQMFLCKPGHQFQSPIKAETFPLYCCFCPPLAANSNISIGSCKGICPFGKMFKPLHCWAFVASASGSHHSLCQPYKSGSLNFSTLKLWEF